MTDELLDRVLTRSREVSYKRCSPAYRWLRGRHDRLAPAFAALDPPLGEIAAEMAAGGITGGRGKALTAKALMRIWQRVRRDLRAGAAEKRRPDTKVQPSRLPPAWQPPPVDPSRAPPAPRIAPQHHTASPPEAEEDLPPDVRAKLAALDRQLDWRDRFVNPPKRKD